MQNTKRYLLKKAFRIIRRNYGCPGNDRVSISDIKTNYEKYEHIVWQQLEKNYYVFEQEPKQIIIRDYLGKEREIFVYNVAERWVQEFIKLQIEPKIDATLAEYVYAFRRGKSDIHSYQYILKNNPKFILRIDIKDYFRSINKENLLISLEYFGFENDLLNLVKKSLCHCTKGLPTGHVLSCILSNFNLKDFDFVFPENYTRYSDDMMFGLYTMLEVRNTLRVVTDMLEVYGFKLNPAKTKIIINPTFEKIS